VNTGYPTIDLLPIWFWLLTVGLFGLAIGSFLNVVIYRLPLMYPEDFEDEEEDSNDIEETLSKEEQEAKKLAKKQAAEQAAKASNKWDTEGKRITLSYPKRSRCPNCNHEITALENIPVLSYVVLGGKCSSCKQKISIIYPFVEALTAIAFLLAFYHQVNQPMFSIPDYIANVVFICLNISLIFIDYQKMILPNQLTIGGAILAFIVRIFIVNEPNPFTTFFAMFLAGITLAMVVIVAIMLVIETRIIRLGIIAIVFSLFCFGLFWLSKNPDAILDTQERFLIIWQAKLINHTSLTSLINGLMGAIIGAGSLIVLAGLFFIVRGIEGMGVGDFKMMMFVGMFLGWKLTISTILLAPALAMPIVIAVFLAKGREAWQTRLPFGVFLGAGAIVSLLFGKQIIDFYLQLQGIGN
jgi:leader peptidase (prepilin peptidase)/N-methyltransferase